MGTRQQQQQQYIFIYTDVFRDIIGKDEHPNIKKKKYAFLGFYNFIWHNERKSGG